MSAVGLSRATMDSARVFGALGGAALSTVLGLGPTYALVTTLYVASLALTFGVARRPGRPIRSRRGAGSPDRRGGEPFAPAAISWTGSSTFCGRRSCTP